MGFGCKPNPDSPYDITLASLADGSHTIHVYARDEAGNWAEESVTYTIDITAPTITHDGPADTIDLTNGNQTLVFDYGCKWSVWKHCMHGIVMLIRL